MANDVRKLTALPSFSEAKEKEEMPTFQSGQTKKQTQASDHSLLPQKKNIFLIWLWSTITCSIYTAVWYIKRTPEFNNLGTPTKLRQKVAKTLLVIDILIILSILAFPLTISPTEMGSFYQKTTSTQMILVIVFVACIILRIIFTLYLAFKSRSIINQAIGNNNYKKISGFLTFIFTHLYLQYEINRIVEDKEDQPIKAPWIWFVIILILIIGYIVISFI